MGKRSGHLWSISILCTFSIVLGILWSKPKLSLHQILPLRLQHYIRDSGWARSLADGAVIFSLPTLIIMQPGILLQFIGARNHVRMFRYGSGTKERLEVFTNLQHALRRSKIGRGLGGDIETQMNSDRSKHNNSNKKDSKCNVLVFVHGGAWGSGMPWMYRLVALGMSKCINASTAIIIEYPVYPDSFICDQADW